MNSKGPARLFDHHIELVLSISCMAFCESMLHVNDIDKKTMDVGRRFDPPTRKYSLEARAVWNMPESTARKSDKIPRQGAAPLPEER